ncbi:mechanosensitive ion channel family protein [Halolamina salifodinae]|uniref:Small-conductance mechanosensitive channel n=1 Tax=Halolamina salifodinae TaxID=1202767 RepID=A0A8T4H202_9EURY|nr:mechanosensitive ion channel family protein [Halolamina salifodinae]MBP1987635.1 small-conductance mechanosensitive channel [Halolamina salifodinae]
MPGYQEIRNAIWRTVVSTEAQILVTVAALVLLAIVVVAVRSVGPRLKEYVDDAVAESLQAGFIALFAAATSLFLISVWRAGWLIERGFDQIDPSRVDVVAVVLSVAVFAAAYTVTRISKNSIRRLSKERGAITNHQQEVAHHVVQLFIFGLGILVVLGIWNVEPGDLLLGAGAATVVFGLAARQTLGAVLAGFVVLFSRPFDLGDWVVVGDEEGIVTDISVFNTQLRTFDDEYVMIPNDIVTDTEIRNRSRKGRLRLETDVGVDYETDVEHAMEIAAAAMDETETPMERPDPNVVLSEFGGSSVVLKLRYYIDNPSARKMWKARTEVISAVKDAFAAEGIKIPFPQRELSGRPEAGGLAVSGVRASEVTDGDDDADGADDAESDGDDGEDAEIDDDRVEREDAVEAEDTTDTDDTEGEE